MPSRAASTSSVAEPVERMSRECGTSPSNAPRLTTSSHPVVRATEMTSSQKVGHRRFGSTPSNNTRSRPPPGSDPAENASAGHWISRITPSTSSTVGRAAWKSRYSSVSSVANTRAPTVRASHRTASLAASAASFQPENAATSVGRRSEGCAFHRTVMRSPYASGVGPRVATDARPDFARCRARRSRSPRRRRSAASAVGCAPRRHPRAYR